MKPTSPALLRLLAAAPVLLAAAPVLPAHAADAPPAKKEATIQQVEVKGAAATYDARRNDTATKIVVTQEEILKNGDTTIGEVLKRLPGVTIGGVQGRGGAVRMRGLGSGYTQIMLNGEPAPPGFSLDALSPDMIERIEVMRAATAEFSTQAIAGGINIVLKRAVVTAQRELKLGLQDDNGKVGGNTNFQVSDRKGALSYALGGNLTYGKFDRPSTVITAGMDEQGQPVLRNAAQQNEGTFKGFGLSPRVNINLGPDDIVTSQSFINLNRFRAANAERVAVPLGSAPRYTATDTTVRNNMDMVRSDLTWSRKLGGSARLEVKGGVNWNKRSADARSLQSKGGFSMDRMVTSDATDKGFSTTGKYSRPLMENHALSMGWDAGYSKRDEDRIQRETSSGAGAIRPANLDEVFNADVTRLALYGQDEWQMTPRWSLYMGLRWEGIQTKSEGNNYAPVDNRSSVWSPLFQTLWKLPNSKNDQVRLGVTRTYKAPGVNALIPRRFTSNNNSQTSPDQMGNPQLKPELAWGLDLAYEHYLPNSGMLSASTFVRRIEDITQNRVDFIDGAWVSRPVNAGVANTRGVELEAKLPLRSLYAAAPSIEVRANVARNWSRLDAVPGPNNRLDQQTPVSGTLGLDYKLDTLPLTTGGSFSFQSGGPVRVSQNQYAYAIPKRTLDWYGLWKFNPRNQLRVSLSNALHQDNLAQTTFVNPRGAISDTTITPTTAVVRALLEMKL